MMMRTLKARTLALVLLVGLLAAPAQSSEGNPNPGVLPPDGHAFGMDYGEWGAEWWNWAFSSPLADNPLVDTTGEKCDTNQMGNVWFLAGFLDVFGVGGPVVRECEIPTGKAVFFPIINEVGIGFPGDTEEEIRAGVNAVIDGVSELEASIDGVPLTDLWQYRAESPAYTSVLPPGAILDELAGLSGTFYPSVTDGYWIMLAPLPPGEHVIHFRGVNGGFEVEVLYLLTVVDEEEED